MAEKSFPFASVGGDRPYTAADFAAYFGVLLSNGVYPTSDELEVVPDSGMDITISAGQANINGYQYINTGVLSVTIDPADGVLNRKDRIVLRWDKTNRYIKCVVLKGTPASSAAIPSIVRNTDYHDLGIAVISIPAGATSIAAGQITDTRDDTTVCGRAASLLEGDISSLLDGKADVPFRFSDTAVLTSAWADDATYAAYPKRASVALSGALATMTPEVIFSLADATSGNFAPIATAYAGGIYLYAKATPAGTVTIPTITLWRAV